MLASANSSTSTTIGDRKIRSQPPDPAVSTRLTTEWVPGGLAWPTRSAARQLSVLQRRQNRLGCSDTRDRLEPGSILRACVRKGLTGNPKVRGHPCIEPAYRYL